MGTLKIPDTQYPIFLQIVRYETDTDTDADIITVLVNTRWNELALRLILFVFYCKDK